MVEAPDARGELAKTIETEPGVARVDRFAQGLRLQEIHLVEVTVVRRAGADADGGGDANFVGQGHLDDVAGPAAFDEAQSPFGNETANGLAHRSAGHMNSPGKPRYRKMELALPFQAGVTQEMQIHDTVRKRKPQARHEYFIYLFQDKFSIRFFGFHDFHPELE